MAETAAPESDDVVALADALRPALLRLSRRLRTEGLKSEMTAQDIVVLSLIKGHPGIGVSALAEREQTSRPTMSEHVKRLEARGLVSRGADAEDGRRCGLALTPDGRRKLEQIRAERNNWLAKRLARLEPDERTQIAAAAAALGRLASVEE